MNNNNEQIENHNEKLQQNYENHIQNYIKQIPNSQYIFEVTKCCEYSTFILVYKQQTLLDLYKTISLNFGNIKSLYVKNQTTLQQLIIPINELLTINQFIIKYQQEFFIPIYPLPNHVVYRLYLDDGYAHIH